MALAHLLGERFEIEQQIRGGAMARPKGWRKICNAG